MKTFELALKIFRCKQRELVFFFLVWLSEVHGDQKSGFTQNVTLADKGFPVIPVSESVSSMVHQCAEFCHNTSSCLSFTYGKTDGTCQLLDKRLVEPDNTSPKSGNVYYWKTPDTTTCHIPSAVVNGRIVSIDGQAEGSKAEITCNDYNFPTVEHLQCGSSGTWEGTESACATDRVSTAGKLSKGSCVSLIGRPTENTSFGFRLLTGTSTYMLISIRFTTQGTNEIVRNTFINGYGAEERARDHWPFVFNEEFNMTICMEETLYRALVNGADIFTFVYRQPTIVVSGIYFFGDVAMRKVVFI
ncbi:uncharacterized protein [Haliotis cracherodii]|uniref:uncharacterized protein n=1 Tax=Haliotis cracherodii TaxID=6455 RepID=UPI0039E93830